MCRRGQGVVQGLFEAFDDKRLRGLIAWLPMLPDDNAEAAQTRSELFDDARVTKGWDAQREVGNLFSQMLGLQGTAWDVYLLYRPGVEWKGDFPPPPDYWMHQLGGVNGPRLDKDVFAGKLKELLSNTGSE